jgi:hypothetical protein
MESAAPQLNVTCVRCAAPISAQFHQMRDARGRRVLTRYCDPCASVSGVRDPHANPWPEAGDVSPLSSRSEEYWDGFYERKIEACGVVLVPRFSEELEKI